MAGLKTTIASMQAVAPVPLEDDRDVKRLQVHKQTRLCKFFAVGQCTRGSACAFAHGQEKLRQQPDFSKTRLCADFMELGSCTAGDKCKFAHGKHELRPGSAAKIGRPSTKAVTTKKSEEVALMRPEQQAQNFQLKQSLHDQAALRLMMSAGAAPSVPKSPGMVKAPKPCGKVVTNAPSLDLEKTQTSFSRQTTWEGVETASAAWSRDTSLASDAGPALEPLQGSHGGSHGSAQAAASPVSPIRELPELTDVMVQVKNTFIEVSDSDASDAEKEFKGGVRRSASLPLF